MLTNKINRVMMFFAALLTQFSAFAADGDTVDESKWQVVSRMPQFWGGVVLFIILIAAFFATGRNKSSQVA